MRRRFSVIIPVLIGVIAVAALFFSSNFRVRNTPYRSPGTGPTAGPNVGINVGPNAPQLRGIVTTPMPNLNRTQQYRQLSTFDKQRADYIRNQLGSINGIGQVNTIVNGNTALIGYSPKKGMNTQATKDMITSRVKQMNKNITNVVVSDTANFSSEIKQLVDKIKTNMPANDLNDKFNKLIQNIKSGGR